MPRLIEEGHCPHCKAELPEEKPRSCPECGGSLQQRHLRAGCLTSAPKTILLALATWLVVHEL